MNRIRSLLVTLVLIGGMLAPAGSQLLATPAAILAAPLLIWEIVRRFPRLSPVLIFVPLLFAPIAIHASFEPPLTPYGEDKLFSFVSLTLYCALLACLIRLPDGFTAFAWIWFGCSAYLALVTLATGGGARAETFGTNPIWLGRAIAVGLVLGVWLWTTNKLHIALVAPVILLMSAGIFATGSRGPLLAAVAGSLVVLMSSHLHRSRKIAIAATSTILAVAILQLPFFQGSRIIGIATGEVPNDPSRGLLLRESFRLMREYPGGVGIGNWGTYANAPAHLPYPHNLYVEILSEQGLIIGSLFALVVLFVLIRLIQRAKTDATILGAAAWFSTEAIAVVTSGELNARAFFCALTFAVLTLIDRPKSPKGHRFETPLQPWNRHRPNRVFERSASRTD